LYLGSETECQRILDKLHRIQAKKRKKKFKRFGSKLNLPDSNFFAVPTKTTRSKSNASSTSVSLKNEFHQNGLVDFFNLLSKPGLTHLPE
jgi:hypothetical protein